MNIDIFLVIFCLTMREISIRLTSSLARLISYISSNGKFEINESLLELLGDTAGPYAAASLLKNFAGPI